MKKRSYFLLLMMFIIFTLGGCDSMQSKKEKETKDDGTVLVENYTGKDYFLPNGNRTKDIINANKKEIEEKAIQYMQDKYNTEVVVNNIVPAVDVAVVMVGGKNIEMNTSVFVSVDVHKKEVGSADDGSLSSTPTSVASAIYHKAYQKEFDVLDSTIFELVDKYDLQGYSSNYVKNVAGGRFRTNYYFINVFESDIPAAFSLYLTNNQATQEELKVAIDSERPNGNFKYGKLAINLVLFSKNKTEISKKTAESFMRELSGNTLIPTADYTLITNTNRVEKGSGTGISAGKDRITFSKE